MRAIFCKKELRFTRAESLFSEVKSKEEMSC